MSELKKTSGVGSVAGLVGTSLALNACCWLPPLAIAVGGSAAGLASAFAPWRPYLLALAVVQIGWGLYSAYKPCADGCHAATRKTRIAVMWGIAVLVALLNIVPLGGHHEPHVARALESGPKTVSYAIEGMHCDGCADGLEAELAKVKGVEKVTVDFKTKRADLRVNDPSAHKPIAAAIRKAGYEILE
jgi:copper chaperone CopZ